MFTVNFRKDRVIHMSMEKKAPETANEEIELFYKRESLNLTPENAKFTRSEGKLISLEVTNAKGEKESFERVVAVRSFPITDPDAFISVREPDSKAREHGSEIGLIENINIFDEETVKLINEELDRRYFTPKIKKIINIKDKNGGVYWDVDTDAGKFSFVVRNSGSNIRTLEDDRVLIFDIDGNCFEIPDPEKLDKSSYKKIEIYL